APAQRTRRPGPGRDPVRSGAGPPRATRRRLARVGPGPARPRRAGCRRRCSAPLPGPAPGGGRRRLHPPLPGRIGGPPVSLVRRAAAERAAAADAPRRYLAQGPEADAAAFIRHYLDELAVRP